MNTNELQAAIERKRAREKGITVDSDWYATGTTNQQRDDAIIAAAYLAGVNESEYLLEEIGRLRSALTQTRRVMEIYRLGLVKVRDEVTHKKGGVEKDQAVSVMYLYNTVHEALGTPDFKPAGMKEAK